METTLTLTVNGTQGEWFVACEESRGLNWVFEVSDWADDDTAPVEILWGMSDEWVEDPTISRDDFERMLDGVVDTFIARAEAGEV